MPAQVFIFPARHRHDCPTSLTRHFEKKPGVFLWRFSQVSLRLIRGVEAQTSLYLLSFKSKKFRCPNTTPAPWHLIASAPWGWCTIESFWIGIIELMCVREYFNCTSQVTKVQNPLKCSVGKSKGELLGPEHRSMWLSNFPWIPPG